MPSFRTTRRVPHTARQMFDLVADVEKYPEFLPLCEDLRVRRRAQSGEGDEMLVAEMSVGYKAIRETFTTRVTLDRTQLRIVVEYLEGPFSYLENRWTFEAEGAGCNVEFLIDYEFKSFAPRPADGRHVRPRLSQVHGRLRGRGRTPSTATRPLRASRRLGQRPFQEAERVLDRVAAHRRAPEVAIPSLQVKGGPIPHGQPEMHQPDRLRRGRSARPSDAGDGDRHLGLGAHSAPCAIARATASLTAPCSAMRSTDTPSISALA